MKMAEKTVTLKRVPADKVDIVVAQYNLDQPAKISRTRNSDGTYDLEVVFGAPPEA